MPDIVSQSESLSPGEKVHLYTLDLNPIGVNQVFNWTPSDTRGNSVWFGNVEYIPRPIIVTGFKKSSQEQTPEPTLTISNVDKGGYAILKEFGELLNAKIIRRQTYALFLDKLPDGSPNPNADPEAYNLPEIWYVEQKSGSDSQIIQFRLSSIMDLRDKQVPGRQALKDFCMREYRAYIDGQFVYPQVRACPYQGNQYFTPAGQATNDPAQDACSFDFKGCKLRFPNEPLPGWFFPGLREF
jgi:lambda family phage minor tail protein L